jgi:hypothetical protein
VALAERSLWTCLDLSPASGVAVGVTDAALHAAAARASGQLEALDLNDCEDVSSHAALAVVTASGASLCELSWRDIPCETRQERSVLKGEEVEALLRAAPLLRAFDADVRCEALAEASRLLRGELLFAPLRVRALTVVEDENQAPDGAAVLALAAAMSGHAWLAELTLDYVPLNTAALLDALVDAALARRLRTVELWRCRLSPASAPALARLLGGGLTRLAIGNLHPDVPAALLLSSALRASTTLTSFQLWHAGLWHDPAAAVMLMSALAGHRSLRMLDVSSNLAATPAMQAVAGASLGVVIGANASELHTLVISRCLLGDAGLGPLVDTLRHNTHLRTLECKSNAINHAFARSRLLPALHANTSLRKLTLIDDANDDDETAILRELQDIVAERAAAAPQ